MRRADLHLLEVEADPLVGVVDGVEKRIRLHITDVLGA
jgi:hypothetical protein